ncbi:histone H3.1/H3.2 [Cucumispora dikerogammari]|nr:histone H3.1/H3.2 [Cucumispora dikerogammari]
MARSRHAVTKSQSGKAPRKRIVSKQAKASTQQISTPKTFHRRFKPGVNAIREIKKFQKSTDLLFPKLPFQRMVRAMVIEKSNQDTGIRFQSNAISTLQEATERHLISFYEDAYSCANHAKRVTLMKKDLQLIRRLKYASFEELICH